MPGVLWGADVLSWNCEAASPSSLPALSPCLLQKKCERYWAREQEPLQIGLFCITLVSWAQVEKAFNGVLGITEAFMEDSQSGKLLGWAQKDKQFSHSPLTLQGILVLTCKLS